MFSTKKWTTALVAVLVTAATGSVAAAPATADPTPSPVPDGLYLETPWVTPGGTAWVAFAGDSGCDHVSSYTFVGSSGTTTLVGQGFGDGYWLERGVAFRDAATDAPLPIGTTGPESGQLVVTCATDGGGDPQTFSLPITVGPTAPASIYHSSMSWTWYSKGPVTGGATVRVNALGFRPGEGVTVSVANSTKFYGPGGGDLAASAAIPSLVTADGEGAVTAEVTLPTGWSSGDELNVLASGMIGRYLLASGSGEPIQGDASLALTAPGAAVAGSTVSITAGGFVAGETVTIALHSDSARAVKLGTLTADGKGAISGAVTLPKTTGPGSYRIWAGAKVISYLLLNDPLVVAETDRISAPDRFSNAVEIAKKAFPSGAPVVYVATGLNYPDALGAGVAAATAGGPLLLTSPGELPASVKAEIAFLAPSKIVVVGGPNSVSPGVFTELKTLAPTVVRQGGADRYEASRSIVAGQFTQASTAFIATGANFPDALSATSAAAGSAAPVILVPGGNPAIDAPTMALLESLGVTDVTITGGPNSVSPAIEAQLKSVLGADHVIRLGGADRFEASVAINTRYFESADQVFVATGSNFPDALAGGVLAATHGAPLLVVRGDCVPASSLDALQRWGVTDVTLLGGPASLTADVAALRQCG